MAPDYRVMVRQLEELHRGWGLDVRPPPEGPAAGAARQAGGGGLVRYVFSEDDSGAYLEFYSFHRVWGDLHARIYDSGRVDRLAVLETGPVEDARRREQQNRRNRVLLEELEAAGLLSGGPVPGSFVVNAAVVTGLVDAESPRPGEDDGSEPDGDAGDGPRTR